LVGRHDEARAKGAPERFGLTEGGGRWMRQDRDGHVASTAGRGVHVDRGVAVADEREERVGEPLGDIARGVAGERRPRVDRRLVERGLQIEADRHPVVHLERERALDGDADQAPRQGRRVDRRQDARGDRHAVGLVAVYGGAEVQGRSGPRAIDQGQRQPHERAVGHLGQIEARAGLAAWGDGDARDAPVAGHHTTSGTSMSTTAPAWTTATSSRSAVSMYSSGPPMLYTAGPWTTVGMPARRKKRPSV